MDKAQGTRFPVLSAMTLDIFSIPAMSSEAERVLSGTKYAERVSLHMTTIKGLECVKSWFQGGLFTNDKLSQSIIIQEMA